MTRQRTGRVKWLGSLFVAFAAAVTLPATVLILGAALGRGDAMALHWVFAAAAYTAWIAPTARRALGSAGFVLLAGAALLGAIGTGTRPPGLAFMLGMAVLVGLTRSVGLGRVALLRGQLVEIGVGVAAVWVAGLCAGPSIVAAMAAIWGFWLVQSLHALWPGLRSAASTRASGDPFEQAMSRLEGLLGDA